MQFCSSGGFGGFVCLLVGFFYSHSKKKKPNKTYSRIFSSSCSSLLCSLLCPSSTLACSSIQPPVPALSPPSPPSLICAGCLRTWAHLILQGLALYALKHGSTCKSYCLHLSTHQNQASGSATFSLKRFLGKKKSPATISPFRLQARCGSSHQRCSGWLL